MLKVDIQTLLLMCIIISILAEYLVHQHLFISAEIKLMNHHPFWYKFFFCRFCVIGKMSMIGALSERPIMFLEPLNYWVWTIGEWAINFMIINWTALILDGLFLQPALDRIFQRQKKETNLVLDEDRRTV